MGELHNYVQKILGKPVLVVAGDDNEGIIVHDIKQNLYVVTPKFSIIGVTRSNALNVLHSWS